MRRFYLHQHNLVADRIEVTGAEARHITSVLRLKPGQAVEFFDGKGSVYAAVLQSTEKHLVTAAITSVRQEGNAVRAPLTVAQCLLKGKKMDLLIQKATELGVQSFMPLESRYCENHGDRRHQEERWQRIMIEACKQCGRPLPMEIFPVSSLAAADFSGYSHRLAAWEQERQRPLPSSLAANSGSICLLLGPEGGLHADDLHILEQEKFMTFSLGDHILRGETAALAAIAIVQYLTGVLQPAPDAGITREALVS